MDRHGRLLVALQLVSKYSFQSFYGILIGPRVPIFRLLSGPLISTFLLIKKVYQKCTNVWEPD